MKGFETMTNATIVRICESHGIKCRMFNGKLQAEDLYSVTRNGKCLAGRGWQDVTGWGRGQLFSWLGY